MILGITFNATADSLDMWYEYNFFDAWQIRCEICQKMMIQHGGALQTPVSQFEAKKVDFWI